MVGEYMKKIQFLLRRRDSYWGNDVKASTLSSGLLNSARFVAEALNDSKKVKAELVQVTDNNDIDREVTRFRPDVVVLEAYWVVPEKMELLTRLHPKVKWIVRNHSEIPFMAQEGITVDWSIRYLQYPNVFVSGNSSRIYSDMINFLTPIYGAEKAEKQVLYLPNIYPRDHRRLRPMKPLGKILDVACFGAIRPLKNHLLQAITAVKYADDHGKELHFHINGGRIEGSASDQILKNLDLFFSHLKGHKLINHPWHPHKEFLSELEKMDVSMQVSFSETFNIVSADAVTVGLPIVTSAEVLWAPYYTQADPTNGEDIYKHLDFALKYGNKPASQWITQKHLNSYSRNSLGEWLLTLKKM